MIGILQRGDLPCSFVSPEVICEGGGVGFCTLKFRFKLMRFLEG